MTIFNDNRKEGDSCNGLDIQSDYCFLMERKASASVYSLFHTEKDF